MRACAATLLLVVLCFAASDARAEEGCTGAHVFAPLPDRCLETIETDRPHKTDTPRPIAAGHAQAEIAAVELGFGKRSDDTAIWNSQLKLGLLSSFEVGVFFAVLQGPRMALKAGDTLGMRIKALLWESVDGRTLLTLVPYADINRPISEGTAGAYLFAGHELPMGIDLELNVGYLSHLPDASGDLIATGAATYEIGGGLGVFAELFTRSGAYRSASAGTFDAGVLYAPSRDTQIDLGAYLGLYGDVPDTTLFLGTSLRI